MRKLISIQQVKEINPIPDADAIEVATVLGWHVVVKKGEFKVGDKVVYAEIDTKFPEKPEFEFLSKSNYIIKTIKLRGQLSQGICFPLNILPNFTKEEDYHIGLEVTDLIGATKYEPPISPELEGKVKGKFPSFIPKTDETRIQVLTENEIKPFIGVPLYETEKLEGVSMTVFIADGYDMDCGTGSHNTIYADDANTTFNKIEQKYDIYNKLRKLNRNLAIQGELIGEKIQSNIYQIKGHDFRVFKIYDIDNGCFLDIEEMIQIVDELGLKTVPILKKDFVFDGDIEKLLAHVDGNSKLFDTLKEGHVYYLPHTKKFGLNSFKVISNKYLLNTKQGKKRAKSIKK